MMLPMASTICFQRACSSVNCFLPAGCQAVEFGALVGLRLPPFRAHPALLLQAVQRRVERPRLHLQHLGGLRANRLADAIAVLRSPLQGAQNQHPQRPLQQIDTARHPGPTLHLEAVDCLQLFICVTLERYMSFSARGFSAQFWALVGATFLGFLGIGTVLPLLAPHIRYDLGGSDQDVGFVDRHLLLRRTARPPHFGPARRPPRPQDLFPRRPGLLRASPAVSTCCRWAWPAPTWRASSRAWAKPASTPAPPPGWWNWPASSAARRPWAT